MNEPVKPVQDCSAQTLVAKLYEIGSEVGTAMARLDELDAPRLGQNHAEVASAVRDLSLRASLSLEEVLACCEEHAGDGEDGVSNLAFWAVLELRSREDRYLRSGLERSALSLLADSGSLLRNLLRALTAVQAAICRRAGLEPTLSLARELQVALEVRVAYAKFRRDIESICARDRPDEQFAGPALRSAATSIAKLTGRDIFPKLRLLDRVQLCTLQERILAWRSSGDTDPTAARRIWQDLHGYTQLLQEVNLRQELLEHDRAVLAEAEALAEQAGPALESAREALRHLALRISGRDDTLDALLREDPPAEAILAALREVGRQLPATGAGAGHTDEVAWEPI